MASGVLERRQDMAADPAAVEPAPIDAAAPRASLTERTTARTHEVLAGRPGGLRTAIAFLVQGLSAKLGVVTGRNLAELCRDRFPRPVVLAMWVVSEIAAMATDLAEFLGGAIGLSLLLHMPLLAGMVATAIITYGLL